MVDIGNMTPRDKDLFCDNCERQITVDDIETTEDGQRGCSHCISECAVCGYKHYTDDMYDRMVKTKGSWNRGLVCFDCANNEDAEIKMPVLKVQDYIHLLNTEERINLAIL